MNKNRSFEIGENGLLINENVWIIGGSDDPNITGITADVGTFYFRSNGIIYEKIGSGDNDWSGLNEDFSLSYDSPYIEITRTNNKVSLIKTYNQGTSPNILLSEAIINRTNNKIDYIDYKIYKQEVLYKTIRYTISRLNDKVNYISSEVL